jgi:hypothetical protein
MLGIVAVTAALDGASSGDPVPTRSVGLFVVSAAVVEVTAAVLAGKDRRSFAIAAGVCVATLGLAGEWWWNQGAVQPWRSALLPEALGLSLLVGIGGAFVGIALARAVDTHAPDAVAPAVRRSERIGAVAGLAVSAVVLVSLLPRTTGDVRADITLEAAGAGSVSVEAALEPADAADDASWFQVSAWQGGGLVIAEMEPTDQPGRYRSSRPVPVDGHWKTLLRLHRGNEMMTVPIFLPADPTIDAAEVPATDRSAAFASERRFLLRETRDGNAWLSPVVHAYLATVCLSWVAAFALATGRTGKVPPPTRRRRPLGALTPTAEPT